jgi:hypothetical protein
MHCPDCGRALKNIFRREEWLCINPECPSNTRADIGFCGAGAEYYGITQEEINKQKRVT